MDKIEVRGARTHNLKNINLVIPRDKLIVVTGLSGSGKSSLAFDTLYAEGQRRYVESLSAYARQFLSLMEKTARERGFDLVVLMLTDVLLEGTQLLFVGDEEIVQQAFNVTPKERSVFLPNVMSRK